MYIREGPFSGRPLIDIPERGIHDDTDLLLIFEDIEMSIL